VVGAWRDLAAQTLEPNPFAEPDFVLPAAQHLSDQGAPHLLVVCDGSEMVACTPIVRLRRWRRVRWRTVAVWRHDYCFLGTPLAHPARAEAALAELLRAGTATGSMMAFEWLPADGKVCATVTRVAGHERVRPVAYEQFSRAAGQPSVTGLQLALSGDRRRRLRRLARQLGATLGGEVTVTDRAGDPATVDTFLALEAAGWKGRGGTALALRPGHADFLREVCRAYADTGRLRLHSLEAGGHVAAVLCGLRAGEGLFLFKIAHDPELARWSPGTQLLVAACERSDARGIDSGAAPDETWLNELFPSQKVITTLLVPPRGRVGELLTLGVRSFVAVREARESRRRR